MGERAGMGREEEKDRGVITLLNTLKLQRCCVKVEIFLDKCLLSRLFVRYIGKTCAKNVIDARGLSGFNLSEFSKKRRKK